MIKIYLFDCLMYVSFNLKANKDTTKKDNKIKQYK